MSSLLDSWLEMPIGAGVGVAAFVWFAVLIAIWMNPWCSWDFKTQGADRIMSTLHAIVTGILGIAVQVLTSPQCDSIDLWTCAPVLIFMGYLVVDLCSIFVCDVVQRWRPVDTPMVVHHFIILGFFTYGYINDMGIWFGSALLVNEWSTPFVNIFWYLQYIGQKDSLEFKINGVLLILVFFFCRILYIPFNVYQFTVVDFCHDSPNLAYQSLAWNMGVAMFGLGIYALNMSWFYKSVKGALKQIQKMNESATKPGIVSSEEGTEHNALLP